MRLDGRSDGVFTLTLTAESLNEMVLDELAQLFTMLSSNMASSQQQSTPAADVASLQGMQRLQWLRVLVVKGEFSCSTDAIVRLYQHALTRDLFSQFAQLPCPVIAQVSRDTQGPGMLLALLADFILLDQQARYCYQPISNESRYSRNA